MSLGGALRYAIHHRELADMFPEGHQAKWALSEDNVLAFTVSWRVSFGWVELLLINRLFTAILRRYTGSLGNMDFLSTSGWQRSGEWLGTSPLGSAFGDYNKSTDMNFVRASFVCKSLFSGLMAGLILINRPPEDAVPRPASDRSDQPDGAETTNPPYDRLRL